MRTALIFSAALVAFAFPARAADTPALPDPIMTPGTVDPAATRDVVCNGTTRERRHVSTAEKREVLAAYNIPASEGSHYEIDHLIPLAIGGANAITNLWPQPWAEADEKDALEVELQRRVCLGLLSQPEAQREVADDWVAAYTRYVGGVPTAVPDEAGQVGSAPTLARGLKARLAAEALRLARRWLQ